MQRAIATGTSVCAASPVIAAPWKGGAFCRPSSVGLHVLGGVNDLLLRGSSPQARPEGSFTPPMPPASARRIWTRMHRRSGCHLRVLRRPRAAEVALNPRGDHSASLVGKESSCQ